MKSLNDYWEKTEKLHTEYVKQYGEPTTEQIVIAKNDLEKARHDNSHEGRAIRRKAVKLCRQYGMYMTDNGVPIPKPDKTLQDM